MFRNFQEHYEKSGVSHFESDFNALNPKHDRVRLIVSAILIPVFCSFFYFLLSGHKYTELEISIANNETIQSSVFDNDQTVTSATTDKPAVETEYTAFSFGSSIKTGSETDREYTITSSSTTGILDNNLGLNPNFSKITSGETKIDSDNNLETEQYADEIVTSTESSVANYPADNADMIAQVSASDENTVLNNSSLPVADNEKLARSIQDAPFSTETTDQLTQMQDMRYLASNINDQAAPFTTVNDAADLSGEFADAIIIRNSGDNIFMPTLFPVDDLRSAENLLVIEGEVNNAQPPIMAYTDIDKSPDSSRSTINAMRNGQNTEEQSRIIMVNKIIGLLKSEIASTNINVDAGRPKSLKNRHTRPARKSFDINKLESILEDI